MFQGQKRTDTKMEQQCHTLSERIQIPGVEKSFTEKAIMCRGTSSGLMVIKRNPSENMPSQNSTRNFSIPFLTLWYLSYATPSMLVPTLRLSNTLVVHILGTFRLTKSRTFESAVLTKLVGWASASFEKSLGQPALPHIIIALNATDLAIDASQWDVKEATKSLLSSVETAINTIPALQDHVAWWRANGRIIHTTKDLLECYYSSVTVVRIPMKGRYMLIDQQVEKLHTEIMMKSNQSHYKKQKVRMLSNSDDLQVYLQLAFDHFAQDLDTPFDFVSVALKINPIPSDFGGNILKLAVSISSRHPSWRVVDIFEQLGLVVASCIMLDIYRHRRLGQSMLSTSFQVSRRRFWLLT